MCNSNISVSISYVRVSYTYCNSSLSWLISPSAVASGRYAGCYPVMWVLGSKKYTGFYNPAGSSSNNLGSLVGFSGDVSRNPLYSSWSYVNFLRACNMYVVRGVRDRDSIYNCLAYGSGR